MIAALSSISFVSSSLDILQITLLILATDDIVTTTISSVTAVSRTARRPAFGAVFLLNNVSHLRHHLLLEPSDDIILSLLSPATSEALNSAYRTAKAGYFDLNFSPLMQAITDDPRDKSNKAAAKEKFTRFFDLLDELVERHRLAKVLEDDPRARGELGEEVVMLVIPSFQRFTQKQKDKEFSKSECRTLWIFVNFVAHVHCFLC